MALDSEREREKEREREREREKESCKKKEKKKKRKKKKKLGKNLFFFLKREKAVKIKCLFLKICSFGSSFG